MRPPGKRLYRTMLLVALTVTLVALFTVALSGCKSEPTSNTPRPAKASCDRCGPRPTLTPTYEMSTK
jgi:hypothetical protein